MADGHFWMTTAEVAAELGRSTETIRRYVRERRLRADVIVINGRATIRISRDDFDEFRRRYVRDTIDDDWE